MANRIHIIFSTILISVILIPFTVFSAELMNEDALESVSAKAGITVLIPEFRYERSQDMMSIGGDDGLGIPEAPDGAWFVLRSEDRVVTLDLSGSSFVIDCISIQEDGADSILKQGIFQTEREDRLSVGGNYNPGDPIAPKTVAVFDFGEANFYSFTNDSRMILEFGNNYKGQDTDRDGLSEQNLFSEEIAQFQVDGAAMTVQSDDSQMYVFAHPDNNFDKGGQLP